MQSFDARRLFLRFAVSLTAGFVSLCPWAAPSFAVDRPDLVVTSVSNPPAHVVPGGSFSVTASVKNQGVVGSPATVTKFYLAQGTQYLPDDPYERAQVVQWLMFEQYSHEPHIAVARFWEHAGTVPSDEQRAEKMSGGSRALAALDRHLREHDFLVGERYSIADIALFAYTHVAPEGGFELEPYPAVQAWLARMASHPRHVAIDD